MKHIALLLVAAAATVAHAESRVTYVGDGRYACSGPDRGCAAIRQRNDDQTLRTMERLDRERRESDYRNEQRHQTRALEDIRDELRRRD